MAPRSIFATVSGDLSRGPAPSGGRQLVVRFDGATFGQLRDRLRQAHAVDEHSYIECLLPDGAAVCLLDDDLLPEGDISVNVSTLSGPGWRKPAPGDFGDDAWEWEPPAEAYGYPVGPPPPHSHRHGPHGPPPHRHGPPHHGPRGFGPPPPPPTDGKEAAAEASDREGWSRGWSGRHRHGRHSRDHSRGRSRGRSKSRSLSPACRRKPHHHGARHRHGPCGRLLMRAGGWGPMGFPGAPWMRGPPGAWWGRRCGWGPPVQPQGPPPARAPTQEEVAAAIAALSVSASK